MRYCELAEELMKEDVEPALQQSKGEFEAIQKAASEKQCGGWSQDAQAASATDGQPTQ